MFKFTAFLKAAALALLLCASAALAQSAPPTRLYFVTAPATANTAGASLVPKGMDGCDVVDLVTTTNAAYRSDGAGGEWGEERGVRECAAIAAARKAPLLVDAEVVWKRPPVENRNALDTWLADRGRAQRAGDYAAALAAAAADAAPGVRFGFYSKLPAWSGMHPGTYAEKDYRALIADEAKRLRRLPSFTVVDEYPSAAAGETETAILARFERNVRLRVDLANDYGYGPIYRETVLLIGDTLIEGKPEGAPRTPVSAWLLNEMLGVARRLKCTPAVWNACQAPELTQVYQEFSRRKKAA